MIHTEYGFDAAGNVIVVRTIYSDSASNPIALAPGEAVTPGSCDMPSVGVVSDGVQIAGSTRASTPEFSGAPDTFSTSAIGGALQAIAITAFASTPSLPGNATDQVIVVTPGGNKIVLAGGETRSWAVERGQDQELKREFDIYASGDAYATISWTVV